MIGVITNDRSVSIWANSHHPCRELLTELDDQRINHRASGDTKHKEEGEGRIKSDYEDRSKIKTSLDKCIHPLEVESRIKRCGQHLHQLRIRQIPMFTKQRG